MRVVTIDGPAGAGKSTVSDLVAQRLGWRLLNTGAMYRAVALAALRQGTALNSEAALEELAGRLHVQLQPDRVTLDGEDVTTAIRTTEVTQATEYSAGSPGVRRRLVGWQRAFAAEHDTVAEGRDQGTIVFPNAVRKFFLTASDEERARRRHIDLLASGERLSYEEVLEMIRLRDARDSARDIAPMRPADDARIIDCSELGIDAVTALIEDDLRAHGVLSLRSSP